MADLPHDEHCVPLLASRSGPKREFVFALAAQTDHTPLGRTRSGKIRRFSPPVTPGRRGRRPGAGAGVERLEEAVAEPPADDSDSVGTVMVPSLDSMDLGASLPSSSTAGGEDGPGEPSLAPVSKVEAMTEVLDGEVVVDDRNELVESVSPIDSEGGIGRNEVNVHGDDVVDGDNAVVIASQSEIVESAVPIDCRYDTMVVNVGTGREEPDVEGPISSQAVSSGCCNGLEVEVQDGELKKETVRSVDATGEMKDESAAKSERESEMKVRSAGPFASGRRRRKADGGSKSKVRSRVNMGDQNSLGEPATPLRRFTRSLLKSLESPTEVSPAAHPTNRNEHSSSETPTAPVNAVSIDGSNEVHVVPVVSPRRFTRSLLMSMEAKEVQSADPVSASERSDVFEEVQDPKANMDIFGGCSSPRETPKKKMELKMSKKVVLTKIPTNVRELIATGLLDGLAVTYADSGNKKGVIALRGVINDGGICCSCSLCKGMITISAYQFELHAGSNKKHPSNFITLDNGSSLHDVIKACISAPLDMLESTIRSAAGSDAKNQAFSCKKCKASFASAQGGKQSALCDACLIQKLASKNATNNRSTRNKLALSVSSPEGLSKNISSEKKTTQRKITTKDFWLHKLVFMNNTLPDGTEVAYYTRGQRLLEGYIKGSGIFCYCCNTVVSPSTFEAHAGCAQRKKPYLNIYTSNGVSLHELSVSLSKDKTFSARENDDVCRICAGDGELLLCDSCPRSFHKECVGLSSIPKGNWYCPCCKTMIQRESYVAHNDNAKAAGRVAGVDPIEQIFKRCIRIVQSPELDASSCVLCRGHDFSKSGFGPRTVLLCDQCEKEFHIGCLKSHNIADLKALPEGEWFCCSDCSMVYIELRKFVSSGIQKLPGALLDVIKNKRKEKCLANEPNLDVTWQLLNGKMSSSNSRLLLSRSVTIFQESFDPIIDLPTGHDLIPSMVYGRDIGHQDFGGMYCAILMSNKSVVSVGLIRILGRDVAELPLVATTKESQGNGYFQALFSCLETLLQYLDVKHLVLPATKEALEIWTRKFGFCEIAQSQLEEYTKGSRPMSFQGTPMLHKLVPR